MSKKETKAAKTAAVKKEATIDLTPAKPTKVRKYKKELKGPGIYAVSADKIVDSVIVREDGSVVVTYHKEVK